ncbi:MAG: hypothetical protein ACHQ53_02270 [Polyangiales bacterium]
MGPSTRLSIVGAVILLGACHLGQTKTQQTTPEQQAGTAEPVALDLPSSQPAERDDPKAPLLHLSLLGASNRPVVVPYVYGYPLYAEGAGAQGVRMLRQENWTGYVREENKDNDGVIHVIERFPALGCFFEGVQQDETHYVPLAVQCDLPAPKERGNKRPVIGELAVGAKVAEVPKEASLAKAFLGEWHATSTDLPTGTGVGYFDTPNGLLGFGFKKNRLTHVIFLFDASEQRWRNDELWRAPLGYEVGK